MVPMHLGLIDGPIVPNNLISTQESPVPFPRFQMAPWLNSEWPSGLKKEPGYSFLFPQKPRQRNRPRFPTTAPMKREVPLEKPLAERCPTTRAFIHLSRSSVYEPPHHPAFRVSRRQRGPHKEGCPHPETFLTYAPGSPVTRLPPQSLFRERERDTSSTEPPSSTP
jgi:hypothetical protein